MSEGQIINQALGPFNLLTLLADPDDTQKRLQDLMQKIDEAKSEQAKLAATRAAFEQSCDERERDVKNREIVVTERERQIVAIVSELLSDLEQRLARLRQIAS